MKLYTEKQLERAIDLAKRNVSKNRIVESLTPIELPSDEEIKKEMEFDWLDTDDVAYLSGAIWMRNKIQGGNK